MPLKRFLLPAVTLALLSACGGGGGGGAAPSAVPTPPPGPVAVIATHLEMTDQVFTFREPGRLVARDGESEGSPSYEHTRRDEVVCGEGVSCVFPAGEDGGRNILDGESHVRARERDASIGFHKSTLARANVLPDRIGGIRAFRVDVREPSAEVYGAWGEWSAFYAVWERDERGALDLTWSAAFGESTGVRPTAPEGSARWRGGMVARTRAGRVELEGSSLLVYDFADNSLDLALLGVAPTARATAGGRVYGGPGSFTWRDLPVSPDGTFGLLSGGNARVGTDLHPMLGQVEGAFYGPDAVEAAGVFERDGVVGAFGANRE